MPMKMKILDRAVIILMNLAIIIAAAVGPALLLASSPSYYHDQFEKNGVYATEEESGNLKIRTVYFLGGDQGKYAHFTDEQLDIIADHIVNFLFGDTESFELVMDDVLVNKVKQDGVRVFGDAAVSHMDDVKSLMQLGKWASIISVILLPFLVFYVVWRRRELGRIPLQYTVMFFGAILLLLVGLCVAALINLDASYGNFFSAFWKCAHHLFFPFNPEKVQGSFFNDTLTMILTLDLFMDAVVIVLSTLTVALAAWFAGAIIVYRKFGKAPMPAAVQDDLKEDAEKNREN